MKTELPKETYQLCEVVADIAFIAGAKQYHTGDSREDVQNFINWAQEFELAHKETKWGEGDNDYIEAIQTFTESKMQGA
jgi:hypothetical protein